MGADPYSQEGVPSSEGGQGGCLLGGVNPASHAQGGRAMPWPVFISLVVIAGAVGIWLTRLSPSGCQVGNETHQRLLSVDVTALDFGEVLETDQFTHRLPIQNLSAQELLVRIEKSCDCANVEPALLRLAPRETATLEVRLDLTHNRGAYPGLDRRPIQGPPDRLLRGRTTRCSGP
jgi:hypothetical protein